MKETLRQVSENLWVADQASAEVLGTDFDLTVNCTGELALSCGAEHVDVYPTGSTGHAWAPKDLDRVVRKSEAALNAGKVVLIFCKRGVSRSATAAAAVLLATGRQDDLKEALKAVRSELRAPASQSVGGLKRWWSTKKVS